MLRTAEQHRRIAEVCEEAARDQSISAAKRALLAERAALLKSWLAGPQLQQKRQLS